MRWNLSSTHVFDQPKKILCCFSHKSFAKQHELTCPHGNGEAAESLDALLVQTKTSFWPRLVHQANVTLIPTGIPSTKMKTTHKRLHDGIEKQLFKILFSADVKLPAQQHREDSMSIILAAKFKTEWKM
jgi:hypothetical protein